MIFPIRVADVMSSPARTTEPDATVANAAATCHADSIGSLVVVDGSDVVGIITSDDFVRILGEADEPGSIPVRDGMSTDVVTIGADATVGEAVETMSEHGIARLVVFDDGELSGLVSTDDVARSVPQILQREEIDVARPSDGRYNVRQETAYEMADWECTALGESPDSVSVGNRVEFTKTISDADVRNFAAISGDTNRIHLDEAYARETRFGRRIAHGTLVGGLISAALARLPGVTIYLSQDVSFLAPAEIGERATAICEIVSDLGRDKYLLTTDVYGEEDDALLEGQATVLIDELPEQGRVQAEPIAEQQ